MSVNEEEFSHGGAEMDENQIGTLIVALKSVERVTGMDARGTQESSMDNSE